MRIYKHIVVKASMMLFVVFTFFACPQNGGNPDPQPGPKPTPQDKKTGMSSLVGSEKANESIKNTFWLHKEGSGNPGMPGHPGMPGGHDVCMMTFDQNTNLCRLSATSIGIANYYVAEYSVADGKITLNLDKNIKLFENYSLEDAVTDSRVPFDKEMLELERELLDPNMPEVLKPGLRKMLEAMKKALERGMFTSVEKYKELMVELIIPLRIEQMEGLLQNPAIPPDIRAEMEQALKEMKAMQKDPSILTEMFQAQLMQIKQSAEYLKAVNPIILTIPDGQTLQTAKTCNANKICLGVYGPNQPRYKENVEFIKQ